MEVFQLLLQGFAIALEPTNIGLVILGCAVGLFIGAMPGLGSVNGVAILLPMTFLVPPTGAIIFLGAIYYGAMYGGAISSIMLGIPGASTAVATTFDGRPMALQGLADQEQEVVYKNTFRAIPAATQFRPPRTARMPRSSRFLSRRPSPCFSSSTAIGVW